jgi:hypothetical protein
MTRLRPAFALLVATIIAAPVVHAGDETYPIRFKDLGPGEVGSYVVRETSEVDVRVDGARGRNIVHTNVKSSENLTFWEQVHEKPAGEAPTRTTRGYGLARVNVDGEQTILPMEGKRVHIERRGARPTYTIEGVAPVVRRHRDVVEAELTDDVRVAPYLPNRPVRVNELYGFNGKALAAQVAVMAPDVECDLNRIEAKAWLAAVYDHHGRRFGRIISDLRVPVTAITNDGRRIPLVNNELFFVQTTFDICIDGSAHLGTVRSVPYLSVTHQGPLIGVRVVVTGERVTTMSEGAKGN